MPAWHIDEMAHGKRGITADTPLRLWWVLGLTDMFFLDMQAHDDAEVAREHLRTALPTNQRVT